MTLLGYINAVSFMLVRLTNGAVSAHNFSRQTLIDLYDEGYNVSAACDVLLRRIDYHEHVLSMR